MNNQYYLFLDDLRHPHDVRWVDIPLVNWTIARNYKQFCDLIKTQGIPDFVSYDHDLSDEHYPTDVHQLDARSYQIPYEQYREKTGYDCAKFLCDECLKLGVEHPDFEVHSMNPVGKQNIRQYIKHFSRF